MVVRVFQAVTARGASVIGSGLGVWSLPQYGSQHRERELATSRLRPACEESAGPTQRSLSLLFRHDQHPRLRCQRRHEGIGGPALSVRELRLLRRTELGHRVEVWKVRSGRAGTPAGERVTRADGRRTTDPSKSGDPVDAVVKDVPQASQDATGCKDPGYLRSCILHVEPVHRIAG